MSCFSDDLDRLLRELFLEPTGIDENSIKDMKGIIMQLQDCSKYVEENGNIKKAGKEIANIPILAKNFMDILNKNVQPSSRVKVVEKIAKGSYSKIYSGTLETNGTTKDVIIRTSLFGDKLDFVLLIMEILIQNFLSKIDPAGIVEGGKISKHNNGVFYQVMPRLEEDASKIFRALDTENIKECIIQVARTLERVNEKLPFSHRDLHGKNIMKTTDPQTGQVFWKIIDLGAACFHSNCNGDVSASACYGGVNKDCYLTCGLPETDMLILYTNFLYYVFKSSEESKASELCYRILKEFPYLQKTVASYHSSLEAVKNFNNKRENNNLQKIPLNEGIHNIKALYKEFTHSGYFHGMVCQGYYEMKNPKLKKEILDNLESVKEQFNLDRVIEKTRGIFTGVDIMTEDQRMLPKIKSKERVTQSASVGSSPPTTSPLSPPALSSPIVIPNPPILKA